MKNALVIAIALAVVLSPPSAFANTAGPRIMSIDASAQWVNYSNLYAADGATASYSVPNQAASTYISAEGFGFSIPTGATIVGIQVDVIGKASASGYISMPSGYNGLLKNGTASGTGNSNATKWTTSLATYTLGGPSSMWDTTLTPADVNASNFGFSLAVYNYDSANYRTAYIDYIQMTVTYTAPTGVNFAGATCTSVAGATVTHWSGTP
jgi:hypothetical protein